ncbi:MAG TPA: hypothetical protein VJP80_01125 [Candidatus Saccharimonadales bacterium]|nr:hypothetical protein [Candidatus Saccharimonadales bacterium]
MDEPSGIKYNTTKKIAIMEIIAITIFDRAPGLTDTSSTIIPESFKIKARNIFNTPNEAKIKPKILNIRSRLKK